MKGLFDLKFFFSLCIDSSFLGDGIYPGLEPSITKRPIHQSLSYIFCNNIKSYTQIN